MSTALFRHVYDYHFAQNREIWDTAIVKLPQEKFVQPIAYSIGSVRNHIVHMINVDNVWFSDLRGVEISAWHEPEDFPDRQKIREMWDEVEQTMRDYLATLTNDMLTEKPLQGEDKDLFAWQALLQVANHGTDHRAQLLRNLHDLGAKTGPQDYIFYAYGNPVP